MTISDELAKIHNLYERGVITGEEYVKAKEKILNGDYHRKTTDINFESSGLNTIGGAANKWVNYSIISGVLGVVVFGLFAYFIFWPEWKNISSSNPNKPSLFSSNRGDEDDAIKAGWSKLNDQWFSKDVVQLSDGSFRIFIKGIEKGRSQGPFAILIKCDRKLVRDYVAGEFGTEFFKPWSPIYPDSVSEIAYNSFCLKK